MPTYRITDPATGQTVKITGPAPPSEVVVRSIFAKLPQQEPADMGMLEAVKEGAVGIAKGVGNTVIGAGELAMHLPGVRQASDAVQRAAFGDVIPGEQLMGAARQQMQPTNTPQKIGYYGEQIGEFFTPTGAPARLVRAAEVAKAGVLSAAQSGSATAGGLSAGITAVVPGGGTVAKVKDYIASKAHPLVRAAIKPTVQAMQRVAGASVEGLEAQANKLVRFIVENRVTTADKARRIVQQSELELRRLLAGSNAPTDAPARAIRYLSAIERQAAIQGLPDSDVATISNAAAEVLRSGLGEDVITMVSKPHPTLVDPSGRPIQVLVPQTSRALRTDVMADEALERARATSKWDTRKAWGEQKGAQMEASKAVERAERDAVKAAVPEAAAILRKQGMAIQAGKVLDRTALREGNRDAASLPAHVIAAGEIASGRVPVLAFAANWLRNNQMRAGIWADKLAKAIEAGKVIETVEILKRLGVATTSQALKPTP